MIGMREGAVVLGLIQMVNSSEALMLFRIIDISKRYLTKRIKWTRTVIVVRITTLVESILE